MMGWLYGHTYAIVFAFVIASEALVIYLVVLLHRERRIYATRERQLMQERDMARSAVQRLFAARIHDPALDETVQQ